MSQEKVKNKQKLKMVTDHCNALVSFMYVCGTYYVQAENSLNRQLSFRGFEPYGVVSWPQGAVIAPPLPPDIF